MGSIEFHSAHLPIGLDGLNAHGVCTRAARVGGGIVLPTLYYGTGGGHTAYPWTIMASAGTITDLIRQSLQRLSDFGVRLVVLLTGHFADEQLAMIDDIAGDWNAGTTSLHVLALSVNRSDASVPPDHAGVFETSLLSAMWPDRVEIDRLPTLSDSPANDPGGDVMGAHRHDPAHPLHGVFGPDPRVFDRAAAPALRTVAQDGTVIDLSEQQVFLTGVPVVQAAGEHICGRRDLADGSGRIALCAE